MTRIPAPSVGRVEAGESRCAKACREGLDDGGLARSFFADGGAIRAACRDAPLTQEERLEHLRIIRDSRREILRELAGAPSALKEVIKLSARSREFTGRADLEAAWEDTVRQWRCPRDAGWSERYGTRLELNRELVLGALDQIVSVTKHKHDIVLKFEERIRSRHECPARESASGPDKTGVAARRRQEDAELLSIDAIEAMQRRIRAIEQHAAPSFECMVRTNLRFVGACAAKFYRNSPNSQSRDDLFQRGTLGLVAALKRFDPDLGTSLTSYALPWIRIAMRRGGVEEATIQVPEREQYIVRSFRAAAGGLTQTLGRRPHDDEVAALTGVTLSAIHRAERSVMSLSVTERKKSDEVRTIDIAESRTVPLRDPEVTRENRLGTMIERVFDGDEKLLAIINARHRVGGNCGATLQELANSLGMTRERVRQLEFEAIGLLFDYVVVSSAVEHRRFEIAARALLPFERPLIRNLIADEYQPLVSREFIGPEGKPVSAVEQRRALVKSAASLVLTDLGETRAIDILSRMRSRYGSSLSEEQQIVIRHRLFGPIREWSETATLIEARFGSVGRMAHGAEITARRFRSAIESIAAPLRDMWRRELAGG